MPAFRACLLAALLVLAIPARAAIYRYVGSDGSITYTDRYHPGAVKVRGLDEPAAHAKPHQRGWRRAPAGFPRIDAATQRKRDDLRRTLLLQERQAEEKSLAAARTALQKAGSQSAANRRKLEASVRSHETNIQMLDQALAHTQ